MRQSRLEAMNPAIDDLRSVGQIRFTAVTVAPVERYLSLLAGSALLFSGLRRQSLPLLLGGGALFYRAATSFCLVYKTLQSSSGVQSKTGLDFEDTFTVQKPAEEVYSLWRRLENLPRFMSHLESVTALNDRQSHWVAKIPPPLHLEWDATIVEDRENQRISWRSLPGSSINHAGSVFFHRLPVRNATEIKIIFSYDPPVGSAGAAVARLLSAVTEHQLREDLRGFKALLEAGERPTTAGQPSGRKAQEKEAIA